jgi:hypothetical protein
MPACKATVDFSGVFPVFRIPSANLPLNCKLLNPPTGVQIAAVAFNVTSGGVASPAITSPDGASFTIPALPAGTTGTLAVAVTGNFAGGFVQVAENCTNPTPFLAISDLNEKAAIVHVEVA